MASDINRIIIIGRTTRDMELKYTPSGTAVAGFAIANNKSYSQGGEKKEQVSYFDCVVWSKLAEIMTEYVKKGQMIAIEGRLSQRRWKDADGNNKSKIEIIVETFQFVGGKREEGSAHPDGGKPDNSIGTPAQNAPDFNDLPEGNPFSDDDVPF